MKKFEELTEEEQEEVIEFVEAEIITYGEINSEIESERGETAERIVSNLCEYTNYEILGFWCKECGKRFLMPHRPRINSIYGREEDEKDEEYAKRLHKAVFKHAMSHFDFK